MKRLGSWQSLGLVAVGSVMIVLLSTAYAQESSVPDWLKTTALWWGQDRVSDDEFLDMIQWLIDRDIITVSSEIDEAQVLLDIQNAYDDGYSKGHTDGRADGYSDGRADGYDEGRQDGYDVGYNDGHEVGYQSGYDAGYSAGASDVGRPILAPPVSSSGVTISPVPGSSVPGCQDTSTGCYDPAVAAVDLGGRVIFENTDVVAHVFAAGTIDDGLSGEFDSSLVLPGSSFEWRPTESGTVSHYCYVHPWMHGLIIVR